MPHHYYHNRLQQQAELKSKKVEVFEKMMNDVGEKLFYKIRVAVILEKINKKYSKGGAQ